MLHSPPAAHEPVLAGASKDAISFHYDIGRDVYALFLDPQLVYSAACWQGPGKPAGTLEEAQRAKIDYHLDAAKVAEHSRVLDIGCGWGALLRTAVTQRGVRHATGLTLSTDQFGFVEQLRLPGLSAQLVSYENFTPPAPFDAVVSIGAFEHFARPGMDQAERVAIYRRFFHRAARWLRPDGRLSLQTIYWADVDREHADAIVPTETFPESDLPFLSEIFEASRSSFEVIAMTTGADDYVRTLTAWFTRLKSRRAELEALAPGRDLYTFFDEYFRTSIVGFKKRRVGLCRVAFRRLDRVRHG